MNIEILEEYYFIFSSILVIIWIIYYSIIDKRETESVDIVLNFIGGSAGLFMFGPILLFFTVIFFVIIGIPIIILKKYRGK